MELAVEDAQRQAGPLRPGPHADDDYLTVTMLAAGLAGILAQRSGAGQGGRRSDGLLPTAWRAAYRAAMVALSGAGRECAGE